MGLATNTTISVGLLGLGYSNSEAIVNTGHGRPYPNLPEALTNAGLTPTTAYSLWLDDVDSSTGSILFGGIDTEKFTGDLISIPVFPSKSRGNVTSFTVAFTSLSAESKSGTDVLTPSGFASPAILDSGTTLTLLPDAIASLVFEELGATNSQRLGVVIVPCSLANNTGSLNFGFGGEGGPLIKVPLSELILPFDSQDSRGRNREVTYDDGTPACRLGIEPAGNLPVLFGDTFLRSAYAVYDLANNRVALAQTNFNSTFSNIIEFSGRGAPIPEASSATGTVQGISPTGYSAQPKAGGVGATATGTGSLGGPASPTRTFSAQSGFGGDGEGKAGGRLEPPGLEVVVGWAVVGWCALCVLGGGMFAWA
jgi:hypothetical protein